MAKKTLTLSFEGRTARMLLAKGGEIERWQAVDLPQEHMNQGLISDPDAVAAALTELIGSKGVPRRRVVTSLTGHRTVSRVLSLPAIKTKQLEEAVRRKAKQELPLPLDETYLSWQLISQKNNHMQVYAFAVPRPVVDCQVEALKAAKLRARAMEIKPLALVRAVNRPDAIIVNMEQQSIGVIIVRDGVPLILRSVPQSGDEVELPVRVERLSQELSRTIQFYGESHPDNPLDPGTVIYATGELLGSDESREALAKRAQYPVEPPKPPISLPDGFPVATYCANLGLALKRV